MSVVQAVLFDKQFFTTTKARAWLKNHGYKPIKRVHVTKNYYRYRIREPRRNKPTRSKSIAQGILIVLEFSK